MKKPNINLFIVGAAKSGTTSLYNYLNQHPEVFFPKVKEPNYYSNIESEDPLVYNKPKEGVFYHNKIINDQAVYFSLYNTSNKFKIVGDSSPSYLWDIEASKRIYSDFPNAKILIILRNPVMRTFSHYLMNLKSGTETETDFFKAVKRDETTQPKVWGNGKVFLYKELGMYHNQVKTYFDTFKKEHIKVIIYEEFFNDLEQGLLDVFKFLEIDSCQNINIDEIHNKYSAPKNGLSKYVLQYKTKLGFIRNIAPHKLKAFFNKNVFYKEGERPEIRDDAKLYLNNVFKDDIKKLEVLLNKKLDSWKSQDY
ncbi:sulfotransferase family protein [Psychroserpens mesophilus]|uniref:sulfotransferase family protein n=1 Tax=Psychroserpens mesophilus TaxID=325473 RepID=UPI00058D593E|nr:sulfotransferase [Psychroserpens mesophilus]